LQALVEGAGQPNDLFDGLSVTAAAQGIVRVVIEGNVEDGTEIEIKAEQPQNSPRDFAMPPNECNVTAIPKLLRVRRFVSDQPQPRNPAALLIDRDDRLDLTEISQVIDQFPQLGRALNIATEENEPAGLNPAKQRRRFRIQLVARNTSENQLTERSAFHGLTLLFASNCETRFR